MPGLISLLLNSYLAEGKLDQGITGKPEVQISGSEKGESLQKQDKAKKDEQVSLSAKEPVRKVYTHTTTNDGQQRYN